MVEINRRGFLAGLGAVAAARPDRVVEQLRPSLLARMRALFRKAFGQPTPGPKLAAHLKTRGWASPSVVRKAHRRAHRDLTFHSGQAWPLPRVGSAEHLAAQRAHNRLMSKTLDETLKGIK